ncbi:MAG: hypothetical protein HY646_20985 [Acidobacteria bacterium]|nr:hypothetical protein [Acidobacteriota bacterium]
MGDPGDELFLIRKSLVRITLPLDDRRHYNVTTFSRCDFFGTCRFWIAALAPLARLPSCRPSFTPFPAAALIKSFAKGHWWENIGCR